MTLEIWAPKYQILRDQGPHAICKCKIEVDMHIGKISPRQDIQLVLWVVHGVVLVVIPLKIFEHMCRGGTPYKKSVKINHFQ